MDSNKKEQYQFDKTSFQGMTVEEADNHYGYWKDKSMKERLNAGFFLIQQVYDTTNTTSLDRLVFAKRKHKHA